MRWLAAILLLAGPAWAQRRGYIDRFVAWSEDGSFFIMTSSGTDEMDVPLLCLSDPKAGSKTWPKEVPRPDKDDPDGCTPRWDEMFPDTPMPPTAAIEAAIKKWAAADRTGRTGPHGETVSLRTVRKGIGEIRVARAGKVVALARFREKFDVPIKSIHWRSDGGAVAVELASMEPNTGPGFGPPEYLVVRRLDAAAAAADVAAAAARDKAVDLNKQGMKLLRAKDVAGAAAQFERAVAADGDNVLAGYNLACAASLLGDTAKAAAQLRRLAESDDPDAFDALRKAREDPDLEAARKLPEVRKLLNL